MNMLVSRVGNSGSSTPLCTWLAWMSLALVEPPTLPPLTTTLALGLTTEISPLISLPPIFTGVGSLLLTDRTLPLSGLGWPNRLVLPLVDTVPRVAMPYWKIVLGFCWSSKSRRTVRRPVANDAEVLWP